MIGPPSSAHEVERALDQAFAARLAAIPHDLPARSWDADDVPESWLPLLAWALSVDGWNAATPTAALRKLVRSAISNHRKKGTQAGIESILIQIDARFDYSERVGGAPFTARVTVYNAGALHLPSWAALPGLLADVKRQSVVLTIEDQNEVTGSLELAAGLAALTLASPLILEVPP